MYVIMKGICAPSYHHNGFVANHALGHMIYGYPHVLYSYTHISLSLSLYIYIYIYIYKYIDKYYRRLHTHNQLLAQLKSNYKNFSEVTDKTIEYQSTGK